MIDRLANVAGEAHARYLGSTALQVEYPDGCWKYVVHEVLGSLRNPSFEVLEAMHDGPLMASDEDMNIKVHAWLIAMWRSGVDAAKTSELPKGDEQ